VPPQARYLALIDSGSLRPIHALAGVRFFIVGQHMTHNRLVFLATL